MNWFPQVQIPKKSIDLELKCVGEFIRLFLQGIFDASPIWLGKEVLGVIYMGLQISTPELVFVIELGGSISYGIRAYLCTSRQAIFPALCSIYTV